MSTCTLPRGSSTAAARQSWHCRSSSKSGGTAEWDGVSAVLAFIPSPSTGVYHIGPFTLHMYGVTLLLAIGAALWLTGVRWVRFGGDWDLVFRVTIYGVVAGIIGARIYHDITSWNQDAAIHAHWYGPFAVWSGGVPGATATAVVSGTRTVSLWASLTRSSAAPRR